MSIKSFVEKIKNPEPTNVAKVLDSETQLPIEAKPKQTTEQEEQEITEILSSRVDPQYGFVYEVRSNNPNFHLGLCKITQ
jgi:hypothetical protein